MPPNPDPLAGSSSEPSILLVEEYDALAVAIGSALWKFAPRNLRRVATSLAEAQTIADEVRPALLIIDLDPPQVGLIPFFERLKLAHPALRTLAIGCGTSSKLAAERGGDGAIRFLEKPFELADFGEAVQTLLGGAADGSDELRNVLGDLDLADLIALECVNGGRALLRVHTGGGRAGELHFSDGHLCHAIAPGLIAEAALEEMLRWRTPHVSETERPADGPRTINAPWDAILTTALRHTRPRETTTHGSLPKKQEQKPALKSGKKIVVIDDTELLLIFVDEILSTANQQLQISTAHTGTEGCRRAELTSPDLILLDYSLPDINGDEVCRRLLENEKTALIPIIMMSGHVPEMTATAQRFANVVATISKPFLSNELVTLVEKILADGPRAVLEVPKEKEVAAPPPPTPEAKQKGNGKPKRIATSSAANLPPPGAESTQANPPASMETAPMPMSAAIVTFEPEPERAPAALLRTVPPLPLIAPTLAPFESLAFPLRAFESRAPTPDRLPATPPIVSPAETLIPAVSHPPAGVAISPPSALAVTLPAPKTVLVGLSLRTDAVQLTPSFQIGRIRARPSTATVSLNFPPEASPLPAVLQTGFDIEYVELNREGQIETMRLIPNHRALETIQTTRGFAIADVEIEQSSSAVELTSSPASAMAIQVVGAFQIEGVELSATFQVARLVLKSISRRMRVTLNGGTGGVIFQTAGVQVDGARRLAEIDLTPL